jgi:hypothetical protein
MIDKKRQKIKKMIPEASIHLWDVEDHIPVDSFVEQLKDAEAKAIKKGFKDITLVFDCDYEGCTDIEFQGTVLETEKERDRRVQKEEKAAERARIRKEKKDAKDRVEYERLKAKFRA